MDSCQELNTGILKEQMILLNDIVILVFGLQIIHSFEELTTGFHKKWYLFKMPFWIFLTFELIHNLFWGLVIFNTNLPYRNGLLLFFLPLMFANGVQHIVWAGMAKKYVPGLITGFLHIILFLVYYFQAMS